TLRLSPLASPDESQILALLPHECLPMDGRLIFGASAAPLHSRVLSVPDAESGNATDTKNVTVTMDYGRARIDVTGTGEVLWLSPELNHTEIRLDGISYFVRSQNFLETASGYGPYQHGFRVPSVRVDGLLCLLSGMVSN